MKSDMLKNRVLLLNNEQSHHINTILNIIIHIYWSTSIIKMKSQEESEYIHSFTIHMYCTWTMKKKILHLYAALCLLETVILTLVVSTNWGCRCGLNNHHWYKTCSIKDIFIESTSKVSQRMKWVRLAILILMNSISKCHFLHWKITPSKITPFN